MERADFTQAREGKRRDVIIDFRCIGDLSPFCSKVSWELSRDRRLKLQQERWKLDNLKAI